MADEARDKVQWNRITGEWLYFDPEVWRALNDVGHDLAEQWMRQPTADEVLSYALEEWAGHKGLVALDVQEEKKDEAVVREQLKLEIDGTSELGAERHVLINNHARMQTWLKNELQVMDEEIKVSRSTDITGLSEQGAYRHQARERGLISRRDTLLEVQEFFA